MKAKSIYLLPMIMMVSYVLISSKIEIPYPYNFIILGDNILFSAGLILYKNFNDNLKRLVLFTFAPILLLSLTVFMYFLYLA